MGELEQQAGDVGRDVVEQVAIIGDQFTFLGRGRVIRTSATEDRRPEVSGVGAVVRKARKAGSRTVPLAAKVIEILTDGGLKLGEVVEGLSGRCAVPRRTASEIKRRIRERRKSLARVEQAVRAAKERQAQERAAARAEAEAREVETVAALRREFQPGPLGGRVPGVRKVTQ